MTPAEQLAQGRSETMNEPNDNYVAWCRYTDRTIVTCDSNEEGAFRVYRRSDDPSILAKHDQMSDCLDDIRKMLDDNSYASRLNVLEAIKKRINFDLPDTPSNWNRAADEPMAVFNRPECPFNYCDQPAPYTACQVVCHHTPIDDSR